MPKGRRPKRDRLIGHNVAAHVHAYKSTYEQTVHNYYRLHCYDNLWVGKVRSQLRRGHRPGSRRSLYATCSSEAPSEVTPAIKLLYHPLLPLPLPPPPCQQRPAAPHCAQALSITNPTTRNSTGNKWRDCVSVRRRRQGRRRTAPRRQVLPPHLFFVEACRVERATDRPAFM